MTRTGRGLIGWSVMALALLWLLTGGPLDAQGTEKGPPPFPLLFEGSATLEGQLVASGELTVRIGDWESRPVLVTDGRFVCGDPCLIAGPPHEDYIGLAVKFQLVQLDRTHEATLSFPFRQGPARLAVDLVFGATTATPAAPNEDQPTPASSVKPAATPVPVSSDGLSAVLWRAAGIAAGVAVLGAAAGGLVWKRRTRP